MTVRELRDFLRAFDDDTPVLVSGYESGYDDPSPMRLISVSESGDGAWYTGRYEQDDDETAVTALVIPR